MNRITRRVKKLFGTDIAS